MAKRGLGRGLGSLFGEDYGTQSASDITASVAAVPAVEAAQASTSVAEVAEKPANEEASVEITSEAVSSEMASTGTNPSIDIAASQAESAIDGAASAEAPIRTFELTQEEASPEQNVIIHGVTERIVKKPASDSKQPTNVAPAAPTVVVPQNAATPTTVVVETRVIDELELRFINPNPNQPRMSFKKDELEELAASIQKDGLLQPIVVRKLGENDYQIIAGERRYQACKSLGLKKVPVRIKEASDDEALELALIENIQREDLNPIEEAYGYRRIMEHKRLTQAELAQMLSKGRSTIANALRLLDLPEDAQQLLYEEKITAGHARAILSIPTVEGRQKLTEKLKNEKLSVRETESIARLLSNKADKDDEPGAKRVPAPKSFKAVAKSLRERFDTNVRVKTVQGKNKIEIEFKDEQELERLFKLMTEGK